MCACACVQGCSWSVIFVDLDAHNRNRQTLCSLLPRESRSHVSAATVLHQPPTDVRVGGTIGLDSFYKSFLFLFDKTMVIRNNKSSLSSYDSYVAHVPMCEQQLNPSPAFKTESGANRTKRTISKAVTGGSIMWYVHTSDLGTKHNLQNPQLF